MCGIQSARAALPLSKPSSAQAQQQQAQAQPPPPPQQHQEASKVFDLGERVRLANLITRADLNGSLGLIHEHEDGGKWIVKLTATKEQLRCHAKNLEARGVGHNNKP